MKDIKVKLKNAGKFIVLNMIRLYQLAISPYKGGKYCSFIPTCSQYAIEAIMKYGAVKGSYLAARRILRCHPFAKGGYDPVP
jgi:putative membrane protein insertion efficiency factor